MSDRVCRRSLSLLACVLAWTVVVWSQTSTAVRGAGATFPYPIYSKWLENYARRAPGVSIEYDAVGSEAGIRRLLAGEVDFGATDHPGILGAIAPEKATQYLLIPSVVGAVVPIVNLPGLAADVVFSPEALAGIYLGRVSKWNDRVLKDANKGVRLPDLNITVVHRSDGSGTSYTWTEYLSQASPAWRERVGASQAPTWPIGLGASGNEGVVDSVRQTTGAIGYVEFIYALRAHLGFGKVVNRHGDVVAASLESIAVAAESSTGREHQSPSIVDAPGPNAYPIASFTWFVVPTRIPDAEKRRALAGFLGWMLGPGQRQAAALGYLALPRDVASRSRETVTRIQ